MHLRLALFCIAASLAPLQRHTTPAVQTVPAQKTTASGKKRKVYLAGLIFCLALLLMVLSPKKALAQTDDLNASLGERIEFVQNNDAVSVSLQVTIFQPEGPGPFPIAVINHGKDPGDSHHQPRYRPVAAAREFLKRGYAVVVPMLRGFAGSSGALVDHGCNTRANGDAQTDDLEAVVKWLATQSWADTRQMIMTGQSFGGLVAIAYSQYADPGFKLFVNFAGGLKYSRDCKWETMLLDAFQSYGKISHIPSLWFYGENDSYFPPQPVAAAFQAFEISGGNGEMVAYGPFGSDAHGMFADVDGIDIWLDRVLVKMKQQGLPVEVKLERYGRVGREPAATGYAEILDMAALKLANSGSVEAYGAFLKKRFPRAFVIAPRTGGQMYTWGGDDPVARALEACKKANGETCLLYAADDVVAWKMQ